jgi:CO/xanthine dehydrogenase Mo-binding subunit
MKHMTSDARAALPTLSRRDLIKGSGLLVVGFSLSELGARIGIDGTTLRAQQFNGSPSQQLDAWIAIGTDGNVTAYTGKCDIGQGLFTAQTQLVAEEVGVPLERVKLIQCQTGLTPDQGVTSGAQSHPANFNQGNLALAGATARETLIQLASKQLETPADQLVAAGGFVSVKGDAGKRVSYGALIGGRKFNIDLNRAARRKHPRDWTVLGTPVKRLDLPEMVTGRTEYVHNVRLPGMAHGRVVRPPTVGATVASVDESSVAGMPGLVKVVVKKNFVGVVCEKPWQAIQVANRLKVSWTSGAPLPSQATFYDDMRKWPSRDTLVVDSGDVSKALASAATVVRATYLHPYHMHASVGTSCAVADVKPAQATIYSPTQGVYPQRDSVAMVLGMPNDSVRVIYARGSGCYGINGADTVSYDAALLSQAVGRPVRVQLMRRDEMAWENFGVPYVIDQRVGLDRDGTIVAWDTETWSPARGGRPGHTNPGNIVTGFLAGFEPAAFVPRAQAPAPTAFSNNANAASSYVAGCAGSSCGGTGIVKSERVLSHGLDSPFWTGPLRSPNRLQNTFAHESFMDEVAAKAGVDAVAYRLRHLRDLRLKAVVQAAAKAANWQTRVSGAGKAANGARRGVVSGRGISCVLYEGDNGYCAMVAEVDVNQDTGLVTIKRLVMALDSGPISNPDGLRNQSEGGALHGVSRALFEEVTWDNEKVTSIDWRSYRTYPLGFTIPALEVVLINTMDAEACGAGETSITVTPAAIGNAIFDATGVRIRQVPFTAERVRGELQK